MKQSYKARLPARETSAKSSKSDLTFITTSQFSPWLEWCKKCVQKSFPGYPHLIIDGTTGWPNAWFTWVTKLNEIKTKYFIMLDEDCFILNKAEILKAINLLYTTKSTLAGVPDDFYTLRNFNSVALNPFFMVGDTQKLLKVLEENPNWRDYKFKTIYYNTPEYPEGIIPKKNGQDYEIFYGLFWAILESNEKILYLYPEDDKRFTGFHGQDPATLVKITKNSEPLCLHMWYSRTWTQQNQRIRYDKLEPFLSSMF